MKLRIKELREEIQVTQKELAEKIDNVQRNVSNWENGTSEPDCETIVRLAKVFDVTIDELFGMNEATSSRSPVVGLEYSLLKEFRKLTDTQKYSLLQFLKEFDNK